MAYALVIIGLLMILTGINNTYSQFATQLQTDFSGSKSFIVWILALGSVGALGYIKDLRQFSHYFMALILISFILSNKGVFANLQAALAKGPTAPTANPEPAGGISIPITIVGNAANAALGVPSGTSAATNLSNAATGNNPGSSAIGTLTTQFKNWLSGQGSQ